MPIPIALPFTPPAAPAPASRPPLRVEIAPGGMSPTSVTNTVIKLAGVRSYNGEITSMFGIYCSELGSTRPGVSRISLLRGANLGYVGRGSLGAGAISTVQCHLDALKQSKA